MSLTPRSRILLGMLWNSKDIRFFLISLLIGILVQSLARRCLQYMKDHPELFEETKTNRKKAKPKNKSPLVLPRGGAMVVPPEVFAFINYLNQTGILGFLAKSGIVTTLKRAAAGYLIKKIPVNAISTYVRGALPATHGYVEKSLSTLADVEKLTLYQCEGINELEYLFYILKDSAIPFEEKQKVTNSILTKYLNLSTEAGRRNSLLCLLAILCTLAVYSTDSYHIILKILLKAMREGKIPKELVRWIIRNLQRKGLLLEPEFLEIAYSELLD